MSDTNEFMEAHLQDVAFLHAARVAALTHPKIAMVVTRIDGSIARLLTVSTIGAVESVVKRFDDKAFSGGFEKLANNIPHEERCQALIAAFRNEGVEPDPEVIRDYLALKYLR